ncbi:hypothetical protein LDENG_00068000 [Lucifuga dentata]|nr:hypothetical protein LDENG_00068000 [Lucifuga dentata]
MNWTDAQTYCREHYTDLSPISTENDTEKLRLASGSSIKFISGWIGLYKDPINNTIWKWSGGGNVIYQNWDLGQPDNCYGVENRGKIYVNGKWIDVQENTYLDVYCFSLIVVKEKKSWKEALEHCREHHNELTSLESKTEVLLALTAMQKASITDQVWIGLHFLSDGWLWINGDSLIYDAWTKADQKHQCPYWGHSCGALTPEGQWENWDCQEKLSFICY